METNIGCQLKQFKSICNHIDRRQFALDDGKLLSDKESEDSLEEPDVSKEEEASEEDRVLTLNISNYLDFV